MHLAYCDHQGLDCASDAYGADHMTRIFGGLAGTAQVCRAMQMRMLLKCKAMDPPASHGYVHASPRAAFHHMGST